MVIVDKVSMLNPGEFTKLNKQLNWLMDTPNAKYGGLDICWMGDFCQVS